MRPETKLLLAANCFFLFMLAIIFFPPLSRSYPGELSAITVVHSGPTEGRSIYFDQGYDSPAGSTWAHIPIWPLHLVLLLGTIGSVVSALRTKRESSLFIMDRLGVLDP